MSVRGKQSDIIGQMRNRVSIRSFTTSRNNAGEELRSWSQLAEVWAAIEHKTGGSGEAEQGAETVAQTSAVFRIRHRTDVHEKMMIVWNGKAWNIRSILPDFDKMYTVIEAEHYYGNAFDETLTQESTLVDDSGDTLIDDSGDTLLGDI